MHLNNRYFRYRVSLLVGKVLRRLGIMSQSEIYRYESMVEARALYKDVVMYGPLRGLIMGQGSAWSQYDDFLKLIGEYESHIVEKLVELSVGYSVFVDIGASNGYFALGMVKAGFFKHAICFEKSEKDRCIIRGLAKQNLIEDQIEIYGSATATKILGVRAQAGSCVVLCDIEGAEFETLTDEVLNLYSDSIFIIELHDHLVSTEKTEAFKHRCQKYFNTSFVSRKAPEVFRYSEFERYSDDKRFASFSEGRPNTMKWILLEPLSRRVI